MSDTNDHSKASETRLTPREAIRAHCRECNGGGPKTCPVPTCPLFPFRMSVVPADVGTTPLRAIRAHCLGCAGTSEGVRTCRARKPFLDIPACALWTHRTGKRQVTREYREARRAQAQKQHIASGAGGSFTSLEAPVKQPKGAIIVCPQTHSSKPD